jgi:FAD/FMN-containing dehydrogenase
MDFSAATILQSRAACKPICTGSAETRKEIALRRRNVLLAMGAALAACAVGVKKAFDYGAAPSTDKESDFLFPPDPAQEIPAAAIAHPNPPPITFERLGGFINDASHLNQTAIYGVVRPKNEDDIRNAVAFARDNNLKITSAGQQHSMGGQSFSHGGIVLDLRDFNRIQLDKDRRIVNVQSGVRWWQLQKALDKDGLSVKSMQSINIFSVGGTLSINAHGIDPMPGPIAPTVRAMRVLLASGEIVTATPDENVELFRHVLGGYGLFGVILDADLTVVPNEMYARKATYLAHTNFPDYYAKNIEGNPQIGLFFGRLSVAPHDYLSETVIHTYEKTDFDGPLPPLKPPQHDIIDRFVINVSKTGGAGRWFRWFLEKHAEPHLHDCLARNQAMNQKDVCLVSRNEEMYDDMAYLHNRLRDTDILQEYFVPFHKMPEFVDGLREVVQRNGANLLNVTIRTVHKDEITALPYAKQDMFGFVLYFNVEFNDRDNAILEKTTSDLVDVAQKCGGTHYLPYQLFYSREQLRKSYPEIDDFFATKKKYDPTGLFTNKFYEKYGT